MISKSKDHVHCLKRLDLWHHGDVHILMLWYKGGKYIQDLNFFQQIPSIDAPCYDPVLCLNSLLVI